jgi:hypothetical protein
MEGFLYTLAASVIGVVTYVAYRHPEAYADHVSWWLTISFFAVTLTLVGYTAGTFAAVYAASDVLTATDMPAGTYTKVATAVRRVELSPLVWLAIFVGMGYVRLLVSLPRLKLTAPSQS